MTLPCAVPGTDGDPYWTRVWPSALALAQQLLTRPELVAGAKVADLGAGLGVGGIAAALAGAEEVVLLDREPLALQCALESAAASGVTPVRHRRVKQCVPLLFL
jgi:predicted nicotinamide N-methyase